VTDFDFAAFYASLPPEKHGPEGTLTPAQCRVLGALRDGLTQNQAAVSLYMSHWTVREHTRNARRRLGVHTTTGAVVEAIRLGLVPLEKPPAPGEDD
jgi:DNA-binding NarL/FixJ family response regulator